MSEIGIIYCSGSLTGTIEFTWVIENFSELEADVDQNYNSSNYYPDGNSEDFYWYLNIYPKGDYRSSGEFISLFLCYTHSCIEKFHVIFTFKIRNSEGELLCHETSSHDFSCGEGFGFPQFTRREELISQLADDKMIIEVKANYSLSCIQSIDSTRLVLDDVSLHTKLHKDLKTLLENKETSDAVLSVHGVDIPVHKSILSARSKVFSSMFKQETIENTSRRVEITDFEVETVKSLLQFIYSANVNDMDMDLALDLLKAADKYDVDDLKEYCRNYLMARAFDENIIQILTTSHMCNASRLKDDALEYFCTKKMDFSLEENRSLLVQCPSLVFDIIRRLKQI